MNLHWPSPFANIGVIPGGACKGIKMQMGGGERAAHRRWWQQVPPQPGSPGHRLAPGRATRPPVRQPRSGSSGPQPREELVSQLWARYTKTAKRDPRSSPPKSPHSRVQEESSARASRAQITDNFSQMRPFGAASRLLFFLMKREPSVIIPRRCEWQGAVCNVPRCPHRAPAHLGGGERPHRRSRPAPRCLQGAS